MQKPPTARRSARLLGIVLLLCAARADAERVVLHDAQVVVDTELIRGAEASVHVATLGATGLTEHHPLAGSDVIVAIETGSSTRRTMATGRTSKDGTAALRFPVPRDLMPGTYRLLVHTRSRHGESTSTHQVTVADALTLHVRTDRGLYRPGQTVRWRVMAVNEANAHPIGGVPVKVAIRDQNGTAIWSGQGSTDPTGMVQGEVPLGDEMVFGYYQVQASWEKVTSTATIHVRTFWPAPFTVSIEPDQAGPYTPGQEVRGHVVARYLHGEPVSGKATLTTRVNNDTEAQSAALDTHGRMAFSLRIPRDATWMSLSAEIEDGAGRTRNGYLELPLPAHGLNLSIVPERETFAPGMSPEVTVITTDDHGHMVPATLDIEDAGPRRYIRSRGAVRIALVPQREARTGGKLTLRVVAKDDRGERVTETRDLWLGGASHVRVREAVLTAGQAIEITGRWGDIQGPLAATLLRHGAPVATAPVTRDAKGRLSARITPPPGVFGLATVRITEARWDESTGDVQSQLDQVSVYIRPTELDVSVKSATRYRPGEVARLDVAVRDAAGKPVEGAGLAASVVDERVLMEEERAPDILAVLRAIDMGDAEQAGLEFATLVATADEDHERAALRALVETLPPETIEPFVQVTAAERLQAEIERMGRVREAVVAAMVMAPRPLGVQVAGEWVFHESLESVLTRAGKPITERLTPWREPLSWPYAQRLDGSFEFHSIAGDVTEEQLDQLASELQNHRPALAQANALASLTAAGAISHVLVIDPWGTPLRLVRTAPPEDYQWYVGDDEDDADGDDEILPRKMPPTLRIYILTSAGPDLAFDTDDDILYYDVLAEGPWHGIGTMGYGSGTGAGYGRGRMAGAPQVRIGSAAAVDEVAVRKRFDETVLWAAGIRTDARGGATLDVPLADSITGWRVEIEALGAQGAIGVYRGRLETALPLFVDADLPHHLTTGDRYDIPVVVANHGTGERALAVTALVGGSLEATGPATPAILRMPAGTTALVTVPVRALSPGTGTLELALGEAGRTVDAARHDIEVRAPGDVGRAVYMATTSSQGLGLTFTVPEERAAGSLRGRLRLYRGVVDQALDGLEDMLREPYGCFEQTSSVTYPNLLVLSVLGNAPGKQAVQARARELVGRGYQRLLRYEVRGGGFSWFGETPANRMLTAYGLLEFTDMARVYPVDPDLIERTRAWLAKQQKADGSFAADKHNPSWSSGGTLATTAYVAWALAEAGERGKVLDRALAYLRTNQSRITQSAYMTALWAAAESAAGGKGREQALAALAKRTSTTEAGLRMASGGVGMFGAGVSADVEVTALGAMALLRRGRPADAGSALAWLWTARDPRYGWGSTQATVLALRLAAALEPGSTPQGTVHVELGGARIGTIDLDADDLPPPGVPSLELPAELPPGRHELVVRPAKGQLQRGLRADLRLAWRGDHTPVAQAAGLEVSLRASAAPVRVGQRVDMQMTVRNPGKNPLAMPTIVIPVPPGFRVDDSSLQAARRTSGVATIENHGAEIHVYMTSLGPRAALSLPYRLEAMAACDVMQRGARAYAYYDPDTRGSSAPLRLTALPRR